MPRPELEVADIFRGHGPAWRQANAGHVSLEQLKVMSAIENCRTAELGGHVARCENEKCGHTQIAYNSCRNRHCPKCQGAAAREWLAEREAELLPVPYFHVVFSLPAQIADIAYQNRAAIYGILFRASAETMLTIAADPTHLGIRDDPPSPCPHDRAGWWHLSGRDTLGRLPAQLPSRRGGSLVSVSKARPGKACRRSLCRRAAVLRQAHGADQSKSLRGLFGTAAQQRLGRLCQASIRGTGGSPALSCALHPPRRHLQPPPDLGRRQGRHLQVEGLSPRRRRAIQQGDDARHKRVYPPLPNACLAIELPPHPLLRLPHLSNPRQQYRAYP